MAVTRLPVHHANNDSHHVAPIYSNVNLPVEIWVCFIKELYLNAHIKQIYKSSFIRENNISNILSLFPGRLLGNKHNYKFVSSRLD